MAKNSNNVYDMSDILQRPVADGPVEDATFFEIDTDETIEDATFADPEPEAIDAETAEASGDGSFMPPKMFAEVIVNSVDGLQQLTLPAMRLKKVFTAAEREKIKDISPGDMHLIDGPDARLVKKFQRHEKLMEQIPFTPGEQKRLVSSLTLVIKASNVKVTPLQAALMSIGEVMLKRAAIIMND